MLAKEWTSQIALMADVGVGEEDAFAHAPFLPFRGAVEVCEGRGQDISHVGGKRNVEDWSLPVRSASESRAETQRLPYRYRSAIADRNYVLVMDQCDITLAKAIATQGFHRRHLSEIASDMRSIAECIATLHCLGYVHGDVKPRNIAHCARGYILIDFDATVRVGEASVKVDR